MLATASPHTLNLRRVLVTGASGTVGSAVVGELLSHGGYEVHTIVRTLQPNHHLCVQHQVDLSTPDFEASLANHEYDAIVHAAQPRWSEVSADDAVERFDLHVVRGLERLCTARTRRLIYTSGVWLYGHQALGARIDEKKPLCPFNHARPRLAVLKHLRRGHSPSWTEVILPSLVYGEIGPLLDIVAAVRTGDALAVDDPAVLWSLVERTDVGRLYRFLLERDYVETVFVAAEPEAISVPEIYRLVADRVGARFHGMPREELRARVAPDDFETMTASQPVDATLAAQRLGWTPQHRFRQRIAALLD